MFVISETFCRHERRSCSGSGQFEFRLVLVRRGRFFPQALLVAGKKRFGSVFHGFVVPGLGPVPVFGRFPVFGFQFLAGFLFLTISD